MNYTLKRKNTDIVFFNMYGNNVLNCIIDKMYEDLLPLPLKRLTKPGYKEEFILKETKDYYELNEDGCFYFDNWLSDREIPINRYNYSAYIKENSNPRKWLIENNGYSFNDCYFIESEEENLTWKDILNRINNLDVYYSVKDDNHFYKGQNATLGGQLEKFWFKKDNDIMLCKKIDTQYDILVIREVMASLIYEKQEYPDFCNYSFVYNQNKNIVGCKCKSFTDENTELITAYDLLSEYNMTQIDNVWDKIIELANNYGLEKEKISEYLDIQTLVDYLITNRDRHQGNIGFLRDADTLKLIKPAPIYDNGSSEHMENKYPEDYSNTTVNGLYSTELECLQHISNFNVINLNKLPSKEEIEQLLNLSCSLLPERKQRLLNLYEEKKEFLYLLQQQYNRGTDIKAYLDDYKNNKKVEEKDIFYDF